MRAERGRKMVTMATAKAAVAASGSQAGTLIVSADRVTVLRGGAMVAGWPVGSGDTNGHPGRLRRTADG